MIQTIADVRNSFAAASGLSGKNRSINPIFHPPINPTAEPLECLPQKNDENGCDPDGSESVRKDVLPRFILPASDYRSHRKIVPRNRPAAHEMSGRTREISPVASRAPREPLEPELPTLARILTTGFAGMATSKISIGLNFILDCQKRSLDFLNPSSNAVPNAGFCGYNARIAPRPASLTVLEPGDTLLFASQEGHPARFFGTERELLSKAGLLDS
jgi:hypothetical protein